MKIVIAGGSGQVGTILQRAFDESGDEVIVLSRSPRDRPNDVEWDGKSAGPWFETVDGADLIINLAGRTVDCRYTQNNLAQMMDSRVDSTRIIGQAISAASIPPPVWLQMSTATIYAHRFDAANDEATGEIGGNEPGVPAHWKESIDIAMAWEKELADANTPSTRKVALRTAMVMGPNAGGVFDVLLRLVRFGLGGSIAGGRQYMSWIHHQDFVAAIRHILDTPELEGAINLASPNPIPQRDFMRALRKAWGARIGLPATKWMLEIGAFFLRTESELVMKSRRVVPGRLLDSGFTFTFAQWPDAASDLVHEWRDRKSKS